MEQTGHNQIFQVFSSVTALIFLTKIMGFVKQILVAGTFGATVETDIVNLSESFIGDLQYVLDQVLLTSFTVTYIHTREQGEAEAKCFAMDTLKAFSIIAAALATMVMLGAPVIARVLAPSYLPESSAQLAGYLRLLAPALVMFVWMAVFHALLNANHRFIPGELIGFNQSVILIGLLLLFRDALGVQVLVLAFAVYHTWNTLYMGISSRRYWGRSSGNPFQNQEVHRLLLSVGSLLLGYSMVYINQQVDKILASSLPAGTVTAMGYATALSNLVGTFISSFTSILFTYITTRISREDHTGAASLTVRAAGVLVLAFLPISILTVLCAEDIISIVYGRGAFGEDGILIAGQTLIGYAFAFVPLVLRELFSRFQYGYQDFHRPMVNSTVSIALNIALSAALCPYLGVLGIALASSVSVLLCGLLNLTSARRHNAALSFHPLVRLLPWMGVGGVLCALAARWAIAGPLAGSAPVLRFILAALVGFGAYLPLAALPLWKLLRRPEE